MTTKGNQRGKGEHYAYIADGLQHLAIPVDSLTPDPANARKHGARNMEAIKASLQRWGQRVPVVVQKDGMIVRAGNGRLEAAKVLGWTHIAAVVVDDNSIDAVAYAIADNRTAELAEWDTDTLSRLLETLPDDAKVDTGFTDADMAALIEEVSKGAEEQTLSDTYTRKIKAPIYEPKGKCPALSDLLDRTKTDELQAEIRAAKLPDEVERFLLSAAERHTAFNFGAIAEWYCHAPAQVQRLAERSALVIIDFDKAIENGFVQMTKALAALTDEEQEEQDNA